MDVFCFCEKLAKANFSFTIKLLRGGERERREAKVSWMFNARQTNDIVRCRAETDKCNLFWNTIHFFSLHQQRDMYERNQCTESDFHAFTKSSLNFSLRSDESSKLSLSQCANDMLVNLQHLVLSLLITLPTQNFTFVFHLSERRNDNSDPNWKTKELETMTGRLDALLDIHREWEMSSNS